MCAGYKVLSKAHENPTFVKLTFLCKRQTLTNYANKENNSQPCCKGKIQYALRPHDQMI